MPKNTLLLVEGGGYTITDRVYIAQNQKDKMKNKNLGGKKMNKCSKCQTEYEGEMCPTCSEKIEDNSVMKNVQENSTAVKETALTPVQPVASTSSDITIMGKIRNFAEKYYKVIKFAPVLSFMLFVLLNTLAICLFPIAKITAFGLNESYGTILSSDKLDEFWALKKFSLAILIAMLVTIIFLIVLVVFEFGKKSRYSKMFKVPTSLVLEIASMVFILVNFIFACVVSSKVKFADEELGIIKVGAYSVVTIIFGVICLLLIIAGLILRIMNEKAHPEIKAQWEVDGVAQRQISKEKSEKRKEKLRQHQGKFSFSLLKYIIIVPVVYAVVFGGGKLYYQVYNTFVDRLAVSFSGDTLKNYLIKSGIPSTITMELILGKPNDTQEVGSGSYSKEYVYTYYTDNYEYFQKRKDRNERFSELALLSGDGELFSALATQSITLSMEESTLAYGSAIIDTDDDAVIYRYNSPMTSRTLINTQVISASTFYEDDNEALKVTYLASYSDGSYVYATSKYITIEKDGGSSRYFESIDDIVGKKISWSAYSLGGTCEVVFTSNMIKHN